MTSRTRRGSSRLRCFHLEDRTVPAVASFGVNAQHTGISLTPAQPLEAVHWQTPVDNFPTSRAAHYGAPLVTAANTVVYPYRTALNAPDFHIVARGGNDGALVWDVTTDWAPAPHGWYPPLQPVLATATNRVYYAGAGGTIYYRDSPDSPTGTVGQLAFFGSLADYTANKAAYDASVFVDTPITADAQGNIYFGFRVTGANPGNLVSGFARISAAGVGSWVSAAAAAGDPDTSRVAPNSAPALSYDGSKLYVVVRKVDSSYRGRLLALDTTTLATVHNSGVLKDPRGGGTHNAGILAESTASPMVAPDGRVFLGVFGNPYNGSRGWMLQFSGDLLTQFTPGGFGWDTTPSVVPASLVPQYTGPSSYLIFTKYNNYYGISDGGDGSNAIAVLDPNDTEPEYHPSSGGLPVMKRIVYKVGVTPDWDYPNVPTAVREWCINYGTVDPSSNSVMVNCADGKFYRWHLPTNTLAEAIQLTNGIGQPYTMTVIGVDGTVYGIQIGTLFAIGKTPGLSVADVAVAEGTGGTVTATFTVSLDFPRREAITVTYATADGTAQAGSDYTAASGKLTFNPGEKTRTVTVTVTSDALNEADESFFLTLTDPANAVLIDAQGQATISNDDPLPALSIADVAANEGNAGPATFTFTVSLSAASGQTVTVNYATADGSALAPGDYQSAAGALTFAPGETSKTIDVFVNGDSAFESNETFVLNLTGPDNATLANSQATGTITNDDNVPSVSIGDVTVTEGGSATFTVTLSNASAQAVTVLFATADGTATSPADYAAAAGTVTFDPGQVSKTITVDTVDDALNELPETFVVNLNNPTNAFIGDGLGAAKLNDNDPEPSLGIGDVAAHEGATGTTALTFTVTLSAVSGRAVTVNYTTADGTAEAPGDYQATSGTLTFAAGELSQTITVQLVGDLLDEPNETFVVNLSGPAGATLAKSTGTGTILNDDDLVLTVGDVAAAEGPSGTTAFLFTVNLSTKSASPVTVQYATADGTANAPGDYQTAAGTITFDPGETSRTVAVLVNGDGTNEADETFFLLLANASGGTIGDGTGLATILNDDAVPSINVADLNIPEGDYNSATVNIYVMLSAASGQTVTVAFDTSNGTASSTSATKDYIDTFGVVTFLPGETVKSFEVTIVGDTRDELDETFFVNLANATNATVATAKSTQTIVDDDQAQITITDAVETEGDSGLRAVSVTVFLSIPSDLVVSVMYATENDSAVAPGDYQAKADTLTFQPGETAKTLTFFIVGDEVHEATERFRVELMCPTGEAYISDYYSDITIVDDDPLPRVSGVAVNNGAAQRSRVSSVTVNFDALVTLPANPADAFALNRLGDAAAVALAATVTNTTTTSVVLTFTGGAVFGGSLLDGRYTLTVLGGLVASAAGLLDGNGDGTGGDDYVLTGTPANGLFRLFGDADGDGDVDAADYGAFRGAFGTTNPVFDIDGDGDVDTADFGQFRGRFGTSV